MNERILLTGATGFVGQQVLKRLQESSNQITLVVRANSTSRLKSLKNVVKTIETHDLFNETVDWWAMACADIDTVIHVAWYAEPGKYLVSMKNIDCLQGTLNLARGAQLGSVKRFVGVGTCAEYENSDLPIPSNFNLKPLSMYAIAKASAYHLLDNFLSSHNISFTWCRLFYLFGDDEDERRLVPYIRSCLIEGKVAGLSTGNQVRDFLDVVEAGRMIADISASKKSGPINVCSGIPVTVRELAVKVAEEYGGQHLLNFGARADNLLEPPYIVGIPG